MKKFILWAVLIPALYVFVLFYFGGNRSCDGFGCVGNGIMLAFGSGVLLLGSFIAGATYSKEHRLTNSLGFVAISATLIFLAINTMGRLTINRSLQVAANEGMLRRFNIERSYSFFSEEEIQIPKTLVDAHWKLVQSACQEEGYDLYPYTGKEVTIARFGIKQTWNGLPLNAVFLDDRYRVICVYKEARQDQGTNAPLPVPNIFPIGNMEGVINTSDSPIIRK